MTSLLEREVGHGFIVVSRTGDASLDALMDDERALAQDFTGNRMRTFVGGRVAARRALSLSGLRAGPILRDFRGAPVLGDDASGSISISHKDHVAAALVARASTSKVGLDIEIFRPLRFDIARRVLTDTELSELALLPTDARDAFVLRRFSAKEAIYKAIDPFVKRYVAFREVGLRSDGDRFCADLFLDPPFTLSVEVDQFEIELPEIGLIILSTAAASRP